nr:hypothetical protein StreXyl84_61680 [Streptomyces sp. Xyl84]
MPRMMPQGTDNRAPESGGGRRRLPSRLRHRVGGAGAGTTAVAAARRSRPTLNEPSAPRSPAATAPPVPPVHRRATKPLEDSEDVDYRTGPGREV